MSKQQLFEKDTCIHKQFVEFKANWTPAGRKRNGLRYICIWCGQQRIVYFNGKIEIL